MAPRDFSEDGAFGSGSSSGTAGGGSTGGYQAGDWNMNQSGGGGLATNQNDAIAANEQLFKRGFTPGQQYVRTPTGQIVPRTSDNQYGYWGGDAIPSAGGYTANPNDSSGTNSMGKTIGSAITPSEAGQLGTFGNPSFNAIGGFMPNNLPGGSSMPLLFEDGGEVPGADGNGTGSDMGDLIALALSSVDQGLDYGRKKHGLTGNQQQASMTRMPAVPGSPSDSGIPRPQPAPGPLPPTSNPFGKRQQFSQNDQDSDDQPGGIPDNDEDDQQETA